MSPNVLPFSGNELSPVGTERLQAVRCNGLLSGDPVFSEGEKGERCSRKQPQKAEQSFSMNAEKHGRERGLKSAACDGHNATGQSNGGHNEHAGIQIQCKRSGTPTP